MISVLKNIFNNLFDRLLGSSKKLKIGIYGPPNSGKTTLANRICKDILDPSVEFGQVSSLAHETRKICIKESLSLKIGRKMLHFDLVDTPGIATRIDYEHFVKAGMPSKDAKIRAKEATKGVIESIKWLDGIDMVIVVIDSTKNPMNQVNLTIIGNLEAKKIPVLIAANKIDLKSSKIDRIRELFSKYRIVGVSAKFSNNMDALYKELIELSKSAKRKK
jgi:GTPase